MEIKTTRTVDGSEGYSSLVTTIVNGKDSYVVEYENDAPRITDFRLDATQYDYYWPEPESPRISFESVLLIAKKDADRFIKEEP